ncbi:MAG: DUF2236 domain-containing protein [Bacteroidetes bacterium]|nr:MAG: DUF2236 domain-containing protein [Bacteroidota bacterium]
MITDTEYLQKQRYVGDSEADSLVTHLFESRQEKTLYQALGTPAEHLHSLSDANKELHSFIHTPKEKPAWYDAEKIALGQRFYRKYASEIMMLLGAMSLPYCYAASPGNKALHLTEKMRNKPGKRLLETAQYVIQLMEPGSFEPDGIAHPYINKTRLVHAMVRYMLLKKTDWNMDWGLPINQEDMAGTNLAFSFTIINGLEKQQFPLRQEQSDAFLHIWRYIGYQMDIQEELLADNMQEAAALEYVIRKRHFKASIEGRKLMQDLLEHYRDEFPWPAGQLVEHQIRYFLGEEISDMLKIEKNTGKDALIRVINKVKNGINRHFHFSTYNTMMKNHERLKKIHGDM